MGLSYNIWKDEIIFKTRRLMINKIFNPAIKQDVLWLYIFMDIKYFIM